MSSTTSGRRRRGGRFLMLAALVLASIAGASEIRGLAWWSSVLGRGSGRPPFQRFAALARGEARLGTRGTAGFFNRAIPAPGWTTRFTSLDVPAGRRWAPGIITMGQSRALVLPLYPAAGLLLAAGVGLAAAAPRGRGCARCCYDTTGLGTCPECGAR